MKWMRRFLGSKDQELEREPTETLISSGPATANKHFQLGWALHEQDKLDEAIKEYRKALLIDPDFALARSNLGMVYKLQGKMDDAIREWEQTLSGGVSDLMVRTNTEDWLKEVKALRDERSKPITNVDGAVKSYMEELGQASEGWFVAYEALARLGTSAIEPLIEAIRSDNDLLRSRAIDLLAKIGDQRAVEPLENASKISEQDFRRITKLSGKSRIVNMGTMRIEVPVSEMLEEYRGLAQKAIKKIKER